MQRKEVLRQLRGMEERTGIHPLRCVMIIERRSNVIEINKQNGVGLKKNCHLEINKLNSNIYVNFTEINNYLCALSDAC